MLQPLQTKRNFVSGVKERRYFPTLPDDFSLGVFRKLRFAVACLSRTGSMDGLINPTIGHSSGTSELGAVVPLDSIHDVT
jgi:hypothetical protein